MPSEQEGDEQHDTRDREIGLTCNGGRSLLGKRRYLPQFLRLPPCSRYQQRERVPPEQVPPQPAVPGPTCTCAPPRSLVGTRAQAPHQAVWGTTCTCAPPPSRGAECHRLI